MVSTEGLRGKIIVAFSTIKNIRTLIVNKGIVTATTNNAVIAKATVKSVVAGSTVNNIRTGLPINRVITLKAGDQVIPHASFKNIGTISS